MFNFYKRIAILLILFFLISCSETNKNSNDADRGEDSTAPFITLNGSSIVFLSLFEEYIELGATANDNFDGSINVTIANNVDNSALGEYEVIYSAIDQAGNSSQVKRKIIVIESKLPEITLIGSENIILEVFDEYVESGITISNHLNSDFTFTITGEVDTSKVGKYELFYQAIDGNNNASEILKRTINVVDTIAPIITLNGSSEVEIFIGDIYEELGVSVNDNSEIELEIDINSDLNNQIPGTYIVNYEVSDLSGNKSNINRVIRVVEDMPPEIVLQGGVNVTAYVGSYIEFNSYAIDDKDGRLQVEIIGNVDDQVPGEYSLEYVATDGAGHQVKVERTVTIFPKEFITIWKTDNEGISDDNQISFNINAGGSNVIIDWGDGNIDNRVNGEVTHTYNNAGTYTVSMSGNISRFYFNSNSPQNADGYKLLSVENWGDSQWQSMEKAFYFCSNMIMRAKDTPDLTQVESMFAMFKNASSFNSDLSKWDVSSVTDMGEMFSGTSLFDQDISSWDVSSVSDMSWMFNKASNFNNDISHWDVSSVEKTDYMFSRADRFNQNLNFWDVSNVTRMDAMFTEAIAFNSDISNWDVSSVTSMRWMFNGAILFNQDISNWNVSSVEYISSMFAEAESFNQDIGDWDVSSVIHMSLMFYHAEKFNQDISQWNVSKVERMYGLFAHAANFNQDIGSWDVSSVELLGDSNHPNPVGMFEGANSFDQDLNLWDISNVTTMKYMFRGVKLSTENYDLLLNSWSNQIPQNDVQFDGGESQYTKGSLAETARNTLIGTFGWRISDGGSIEPN